MDREIKQYYAQIKHYFIYHFDEPGMWDDFSERLTKLRKEREEKAEAARKAATEARLALAAVKMRKKRARAKTFNIIYNCIGGFVITLIIAGLHGLLTGCLIKGLNDVTATSTYFVATC